MPVTDLNHFFLRANDIEETKDFYVKVLGFEVMPRPEFPFPGYWLGIDGKIQVHMGSHGIEQRRAVLPRHAGERGDRQDRRRRPHRLRRDRPEEL